MNLQNTCDIKVYIHRRPNLRNDEYTLFMGQQFLKDLFDNPEKDITDTKSVTLMYPERWCNILEIRHLFKRIEDRCPNIKELRIYSANEHLCTVTPNGCLFIAIQEENELEIYSETPYTIDKRFSIKPSTESNFGEFKPLNKIVL